MLLVIKVRQVDKVLKVLLENKELQVIKVVLVNKVQLVIKVHKVL